MTMQPVIWEWPREWRGTTKSQFQLLPSSLSSSSPYTGQVTPYGPQVQRFIARLTFPSMKADKHRKVQAFITRARGIAGLIRIVDYHRMATAYDQFVALKSGTNFSDGSAWSDGKQWVDGLLPPFIEVDEPADEGANSIVVRGLPASLSAIGMGDLFEIRPNGIPANHGHLYEIVHDAKTNASGKTRFYFEAPLRKGIAAGDMIVLRFATSVFRLSSDSEGAIQRGLASVGDVGLSLDEVLPWQ